MRCPAATTSTTQCLGLTFDTRQWPSNSLAARAVSRRAQLAPTGRMGRTGRTDEDLESIANVRLRLQRAPPAGLLESRPPAQPSCPILSEQFHPTPLLQASSRSNKSPSCFDCCQELGPTCLRALSATVPTPSSPPFGPSDVLTSQPLRDASWLPLLSKTVCSRTYVAGVS